MTSKRRVLVVDDSDEITKMVVAILEAGNHAAVAAHSMAEACVLLKNQTFEVVLSDLGMEPADGWELAEYVRTHYPSIRFVLATGWAAQVDPEEARARGVAQTISKPFRASELNAAVDGD